MFSSRFVLFPTIYKKKIGVKKKFRCGFFRKTILSHFTFCDIFNIKKKY